MHATGFHQQSTSLHTWGLNQCLCHSSIVHHVNILAAMWCRLYQFSQVAETDVLMINPNKNAAEEACVLIAMLIFIRICVYFSLKNRTAK